jgi:phage terminase large subunit GpA-like protein
MGSQMGKTAGLLNVIGHRLDDDPAPLIYVGPTRNNIDNVIEPKINDLLKGTPSLWAKCAKGKHTTKTHKRIGGISLRLAWAGSPTELASDSAVMVLVDEIDRMAANIQGEGHVMELAEARTSTYPDGRVIGTSTPTLGNVDSFIHPISKMEQWAVSDMVASPIWRLWQEGSRYEWAWPCPHCGVYFIPRFCHLVWPDKATPDQARLAAYLRCPHCQGQIHDAHKTAMNQRGVFVAPGQSVTQEGEIRGEADTRLTDTASFWVSGLCSFSHKKTWGFLAKKFLAAVNSGEPERIQGVINTDFGECFKMGGEAPEWRAVWDRQQPYPQGEVPSGVRLITAGVDVQKNRLVHVIRGWGARFESWLIDYGECWGETDQPPVWAELSDVLQREWQGHPLSKAAIDSGYQTTSVYQFCRRHPALAIAAKGHDQLEKPFKKTELDVNRQGKAVKHGLPLWHFNSDQMKSFVHSRINWPVDQPGGWWLCEGMTEAYCKQIVAEQRVVKLSGKIRWIKVKKDNHYLDAEALAYLAVKIVTTGREYTIEGTAPVQRLSQRRMIHHGMTYE